MLKKSIINSEIRLGPTAKCRAIMPDLLGLFRNMHEKNNVKRNILCVRFTNSGYEM